MNKNYKPKQEVINFIGNILRSMQDEGTLADSLSRLNQGKIKNLEQAIEEIKNGTDFGRAIYGIMEHVYYQTISSF